MRNHASVMTSQKHQKGIKRARRCGFNFGKINIYICLEHIYMHGLRLGSRISLRYVGFDNVKSCICDDIQNISKSVRRSGFGFAFFRFRFDFRFKD